MTDDAHPSDADEPADGVADKIDDSTDDVGDAGDELAADDGEPGEVLAGHLVAEIGEDEAVYELSDWAGESRALLDALLTSEEVPHLWHGGELTVPLPAADQVEQLIDEVQATATPTLDIDRTRVVYEVGSWSAALQTSLAESLVVADIPYEWNEAGDLTIYADDEERVDEILEAMPDPDDEALAETDGLAVQEVLGQLFLASSTLARSPDDADAVISLAEHAQRLEAIAVPFGFEPPAWHALVATVTSLRDALEADPLEDELDQDADDDDEADDDAPVTTEGDDDAQGANEDELTDDDLRERAAQVRDLIRTYV